MDQLEKRNEFAADKFLQTDRLLPFSVLVRFDSINRDDTPRTRRTDAPESMQEFSSLIWLSKR